MEDGEKRFIKTPPVRLTFPTLKPHKLPSPLTSKAVKELTRYMGTADYRAIEERALGLTVGIGARDFYEEAVWQAAKKWQAKFGPSDKPYWRDLHTLHDPLDETKS